MAAADWLAAFLYRLITTTTLSDIASARGFYDQSLSSGGSAVRSILSGPS